MSQEFLLAFVALLTILAKSHFESVSIRRKSDKLMDVVRDVNDAVNNRHEKKDGGEKENGGEKLYDMVCKNTKRLDGLEESHSMIVEKLGVLIKACGGDGDENER